MAINKSICMIMLAIIIPAYSAANWVDYGKKWVDYGKQWESWGQKMGAYQDSDGQDHDDYSKYFDDADEEDDTEQYFGPLSVAKKDYKKNLKVNGPASLKKVTVNKNLIVRGPLDAHDLTAHGATIYGPASVSGGTINSIITRGTLDITEVTAQTIDVDGPLSASKSTINKTARIKGPVSVENSTFGKLMIYSSGVSLSNSTVDSISIASYKKIPELHLDNTTIKGSIVFVGKRGKVYLSSTSTKINKKQIQNGDIQGTKNNSDDHSALDIEHEKPEYKTAQKKQAANTVIIDGKPIELKDGQSITFKNGVMSIA